MASVRLVLSVLFLIQSGRADVSQAVVSSINELYRVTIDDGNYEYFSLQDTLASREQEGTVSLVLLLDCVDTGVFSLHCFKLNTADNALEIVSHTVGTPSEPTPQDLALLDQMIFNQTLAVITPDTNTVFTSKETLTDCEGVLSCNYTLITRDFLNGTQVVSAVTLLTDVSNTTLYLDTRNATILDQLNTSTPPEPLYFYIFAALVGIIMTYASLAYFWQRTNSLPFLKRRVDQHFPFDMGTGRSQ